MNIAITNKVNQKKIKLFLSGSFHNVKLWLPEISLIMESPKDYLFSFSLPRNKNVSIQPYDPYAYEVANDLIAKIGKVSSNLKAHLIGSVGLGASGQNDLDIYVECPASAFNQYISDFVAILGKPQKIRRKSVEWKTTYRGYVVELTLIDPTNPRFLNQMKIFNLLTNNQHLRKEYDDLKQSLDGLSIRDYTIGRMKFFNKITRLHI